MQLNNTSLGQTNSYIDCPLTNFPLQEDTWKRMMDINSVLAPLVKQYNAYIDIGNYTAANKIISDNPDLLDCFFNADKWNQLRDAIIAVERYFLEEVETFIINVEQHAIGINDAPTNDEAPTVAYSAKKVNELINDINNLINKSHHKMNILIPTAEWSASYPYTQTVAVSGISASDAIKVIGVYIADGSTLEQVKSWNKAAGFLMHNPGGVADGEITFKAWKKPVVDFTVIIEGV